MIEPKPVVGTTAVRLEEDLLGQREIPADVYWGVHTLRAMENFQLSGVPGSAIPEFVRAMVQVKKAVAMTNEKLGVLPTRLAEAIIAACDEILRRGRCMDQFPIDVIQGGAGTSLNMNVNEVIANLALEHLGLTKGRYDVVNPNDHVNKSQSTNDAYPTGLRIALYECSRRLTAAVSDLADAFAAKGQEFDGVLKMGRTQLQDAVPMTLGQEFTAFARMLRTEINQLERREEQLLEVNLGATAIGTGLNTPPGYTAQVIQDLREVTGLPVRTAEDLVAATADTGALVGYHATLKAIAVKLSKISNDLRLLSSGPRAGLAELNLPEMQAGSSIMPAKVNPVIPEVVNQICFKVMGNDLTVTLASEAGQLQLNVMEPVMAQAMFESTRLLERGCITLMERCVRGITANEDVAKRYVTNSIGLVSYLSPFIGHHYGDLVGKECARSGRGVREVVLEMGLMSAEQLDEILSVANLMDPQYQGRLPADDPSVLAPTADEAAPEPLRD